jgi:hypothetical protein
LTAPTRPPGDDHPETQQYKIQAYNLIWSTASNSTPPPTSSLDQFVSQVQEQPIPTVEPYIQDRQDSSHSARHGWRTADKFAEADPTFPYKANDNTR